MIEVKGKNIALRTMNLKELRALWRKYIPAEGSYTYDEEAIDKRFERMEQIDQWNPTVGIFTKNDEIVGELTFERIVFSEQRCDLSLMLANETYRGKGMGTEAVMLAKSYAKEKLGLKRMYSEVSPSNTAMQSLLKKCGFQHTRTLPAGTMVFFAIL
jgi:RimJ/RimL family protein N-acetyltransferase